jgi:hypothetical protein
VGIQVSVVGDEFKKLQVTVKFVVLKVEEVFAAEMANGNPKQDVGTRLLFFVRSV